MIITTVLVVIMIVIIVNGVSTIMELGVVNLVAHFVLAPDTIPVVLIMAVVTVIIKLVVSIVMVIVITLITPIVIVTAPAQ